MITLCLLCPCNHKKSQSNPSECHSCKRMKIPKRPRWYKFLINVRQQCQIRPNHTRANKSTSLGACFCFCPPAIAIPGPPLVPRWFPVASPLFLHWLPAGSPLVCPLVLAGARWSPASSPLAGPPLTGRGRPAGSPRVPSWLPAFALAALSAANELPTMVNPVKVVS